MLKIHLFGNHPGEFVDDRTGCSNRVVIDELLDHEEQVLNNANIRSDQLFNSRTQDFDDHILASESRPMHLSKRSRRERLLMKLLENGFERTFQLTMDSLSKLNGWERRDPIVQLGQLFEVDVGNNVRANAEDLSQFDETRSERRDSRSQFARALAVGFIG